MIPRIVPHNVLPLILKTFEIRPARATFSCFAGPQVMLFDPGIKNIVFITKETYDGSNFNIIQQVF